MGTATLVVGPPTPTPGQLTACSATGVTGAQQGVCAAQEQRDDMKQKLKARS